MRCGGMERRGVRGCVDRGRVVRLHVSPCRGSAGVEGRRLRGADVRGCRVRCGRDVAFARKGGVARGADSVVNVALGRNGGVAFSGEGAFAGGGRVVADGSIGAGRGGMNLARAAGSGYRGPTVIDRVPEAWISSGGL